jgi:hypothetical protein
LVLLRQDDKQHKNNINKIILETENCSCEYFVLKYKPKTMVNINVIHNDEHKNGIEIIEPTELPIFES